MYQTGKMATHHSMRNVIVGHDLVVREALYVSVLVEKRPVEMINIHPHPRRESTMLLPVRVAVLAGLLDKLVGPRFGL